MTLEEIFKSGARYIRRQDIQSHSLLYMGEFESERGGDTIYIYKNMDVQPEPQNDKERDWSNPYYYALKSSILFDMEMCRRHPNIERYRRQQHRERRKKDGH